MQLEPQIGKALNRPDAHGSTSEGALTVGTADSTALAKACADCAVRPSMRAVSPASLPSPTDIGLHQGRLADTTEARKPQDADAFRALEQCVERCQLRGAPNELPTAGRVQRVRQ